MVQAEDGEAGEGAVMQGGYPSNQDLKRLKEALATDDFLTGARAVADLFLQTGYGRCRWLSPSGRVAGLTLATGGWSGCEQILEATRGTSWRILFWWATYRGGAEVFLVDPHDAVMPRAGVAHEV